MAGSVTPAEIKAIVAGRSEYAFLDVREEGEYSLGHPLFAGCLPLSHLEMRAAKLIPRRTTRTIIYGDASGSADAAAAKLHDLGYSEVAIMQGGIEGWKAAGYHAFIALNSLCKSFGEVIEHVYGTPHMPPLELKARLERGEPALILDSRPLDEYELTNIPGALDCPGAELVYRVYDAVSSPEQLVVVNCAGRTRSIIGAQSLIDAGIPNRVVALQDGTMGWHLAGFGIGTGEPPSCRRADAAGPGAGAGGGPRGRAALRRSDDRPRRSRALQI